MKCDCNHHHFRIIRSRLCNEQHNDENDKYRVQNAIEHHNSFHLHSNCKFIVKRGCFAINHSDSNPRTQCQYELDALTQ